jgi:hypothetical protein
VAASGTLIAAGKSSRNDGLVWIGDALAPIDGLSDASSGVGIEAMLEGESPLGVAALPNRVVPGAVVPQVGSAGAPAGPALKW